MFGSIRLIFMVLIISGIAGAGMYVMKLRADNAILKANQMALEQSINSQKKLLEQQKVDFDAIMEANKQMNILVNNLKEDMRNLDKRFNKKNRDIGKIATKKPNLVEKIINNASERAKRCVEIASGAPLTEAEINATKKSEINPECPALANPNYKPYAVQP
jgi:peptidoglycan hydrolase CwlO-like protein